MVSDSTSKTLPVLRWVGGKRNLVPEITKYVALSKYTGKYYEPFIGGGAVFFGFDVQKSFISDVNVSLIHFYLEMKANPRLLSLIEKESRKYEKLADDEKIGYFYDVRDNFNRREMNTRHSIDFYVLNKLSFNGIFRENSSGNYSTPFGYKKLLITPNVQNWNLAVLKLKKSTIRNWSFEKTCTKPIAGDFVYLDPPYVSTSDEVSFTAYSSKGFSIEKHRELAEICRDLSKRKVKFLLSNSDTTLTREIFSDFRINEISASRTISAKSTSRNPVTELLIHNM